MPRRAAHALSLPLALLCACRSQPTPEPLSPPPLEGASSGFAGTVLTGRQPSPTAADDLAEEATLAVRLTVSYASSVGDALAPLASRTRLNVAARGQEPLLPTATLALGARVGADADAAAFADAIESGADRSRAVRVFGLRGILAPGVTTMLFARSVEVTVAPGGELVQKQLGVLVSRDAPDAPPTVALLIEDLGSDDPDDAERSVLRRQLVLLEDAPAVDGAPLVLTVPSRIDFDDDRTFVVRVTVETPARDDARHTAELARAAAELRREATDAAAATAVFGPDDRRAQALRTSLRALDLAANHRGVLVFLASNTDRCPLALDLALAGDTTTLAAWAQLLNEARAGATPEDRADDAVAWSMERTAFALLSRALDDDELTPGQRALLARHAGAVGTFPGAVSAILGRVQDQAEFDAAVVRENLEFLDAADPAARVRAFDWLAARGRAPDGYDPLADRAARRAALERATQGTAEADGR